MPGKSAKPTADGQIRDLSAAPEKSERAAPLPPVFLLIFSGQGAGLFLPRSGSAQQYVGGDGAHGKRDRITELH